MSYQVSSIFLQKFSPKEIHELKRVFKEHDRDEAVAVPVNEIHTVLQKIGENVTPNQTMVMLQQIKLARPEQITFQEFLELLYDFRNGAIALDPALLMSHASVSSSPSSVSSTPASDPVAATPEPVPLVQTQPFFASQKTTNWPPNHTSKAQTAAPTFAQKASWPPGGTPTTPTASPAPLASKPQWPSAANQTASWGHTPSSAPQTPAPVEIPTQAKPQWPPAKGTNDAKKPPAVSTASSAAAATTSPVARVKWPPAGGSTSEKSATTPQWPPAGTSSPSASEKSATNTPVAAKTSPWSPASTGTVKAQWPRASASSLEAPSRSQRASSTPPAPIVSSTSPYSSRKQTAPSTPSKDEVSSANMDAHTLNVLQRRASAAAQYNTKIHEVKSTAGGLHSYSEEETVAFTEHINNTLQADKDVAALIPIRVDGGLFQAVCDGVVLCKLINRAVPETIDERALNIVKRAKELNVYQKTENQNLCINAAKSIGCSVVNIGPEDLIQGKPILVLGLVWQIIKIQLTSTINLKNHPELMRLLLEGETLEAFMKLPPDQILLRWMNYHLQAAGHPKKVTNFSTDVQDATAYSVLLHHIAPRQCDLCPESIPEARAAHVIQNARRLAIETFIKPRDITSGNPKLNMSFVAQLFNTCPALDVVEEELKQLEEILYDDVGDTREERVFRMWINSLAIEDVYINHLYSDLSDGMKLLKVLDKIQKGIVAWNKVNLVAPNKFKQVENCNYCVVLGKQLKFSLVNIGGADIYEGAKKLILSIVWQSMRYQQLKILSDLASAGRGEITDKDIIGWANEKVRQGGRTKGSIVSFRDPELADGLFLLDLVHAVEPRAVNWDMVAQNMTPEAKASNAKYVISCAQKIGASVFLTYEDIVEVKPKMMMTLVASLMLVDHQRT